MIGTIGGCVGEVWNAARENRPRSQAPDLNLGRDAAQQRAICGGQLTCLVVIPSPSVISARDITKSFKVATLAGFRPLS
jgi:hypothetical protein